MTRYSVLDLAPVPEGSTPSEALRASGELARLAEESGYTRFWMAEHHNMEGIASAATAVALGHVGAQTRTIRIGAGGIMLPNHAPLVIAEQFGTLEALFPGRVDIGLGRAPGTDQETARALRRGLTDADAFPRDVIELMGFFEPAEPGQRVRAIPGEGSRIPVFILGSSLYGAQLAAHLGLPYAFASHFAPQALRAAVEVYRRDYRPSQAHPKPYFILAANVFAGESDEEGRFLMTSMQQAFANLRLGMPGKLPRPVEDLETVLPFAARPMVDAALSVSAVGSKATVRERLGALIDEFQPEEVILTGQIHDSEKRKRSFAIAAEAMKELAERRRAA